MENTTDDPLLTTEQTAELLGVKRQTLETWRCKKRYGLPYIKVGSKVFYRRSAGLAFLESRTVAA